MADLKKTIDIVFGAVDNTGNVVKGVGKNIDALGTSVGNIAGPLDSIANSVLAVDAAIVAMGVAMAGIAVKEAADFKTSFNEISTLFTTTGENLDQFSTQIQDYAGGSTQSIEDINAAIYASISAGVDYKDSLTVVAQAEKLAVAGKAGLSDTLIALVSTLNSYGAEMSDAGGYSDTFFKIVKQGQTTIPELSSSLSKVTGIAANSGVSFEELGAAVASLTGSGIRTSESISGIKAALGNILKPTKDARDEAERLGLQFDSAAISSKGFGGFIEDIKNKTGGSVDSMTKLFGSVEGLNAILTLTGNGNAKFIESLAIMQSEANLLDEAFTKMSENLDLVSQNMQNNLRLAFVGFGANILPQFTQDVEAISQVFSAISFSFNSTDAFEEVYAALNELGFDFEQFALAIAESLPEALSLVNFSGALAAWSGVGDQLSGLFDGVDVATPEGLSEAIQKVVDSVSSLGTVTEGMASNLVPFVKEIFNAIDAFNGLSEKAKLTTGETLGLGKVVNTLLPVLDGMSTAITTLGGGLSLLATKGLVDSAKGLTGIIPQFDSATVSAGKFAKGMGILSSGAVGWEIGSLIHDNFGEEIQDGIESVVDFTESLFGLGEQSEEFKTESKKLIDSFAAIGVTVKESDLAVSNIQGMWDIYYNRINDVEQGNKDLGESFKKVDEEAAELAQSNKDLEYASGTYINGVKQTAEAIDEVTKSTGELVAINNTATDDQEEVAKAIKYTADQALKLEIALAGFSTEIYKASIELDIQQAKNELESYRLAIESVTDSIVGSQSLMSDLVGSLASGSNLEWFERDQVMRIIRDEAELKKEQMKLQNELVQAELDSIKLKNDYLKSGGAAINISAAGLEPEIEAFMFKILEKIQIRATAEQAAYLIGA